MSLNIIPTMHAIGLFTERCNLQDVNNKSTTRRSAIIFKTEIITNDKRHTTAYVNHKMDIRV